MFRVLVLIVVFLPIDIANDVDENLDQQFVKKSHAYVLDETIWTDFTLLYLSLQCAYVS